MVGVVEDLILGRRDVDGLELDRAVFLFGRYFACEIEHAGVAALGDLPVEQEFEILEDMGEDEVSAFIGLGLAGSGTGELDGAFVHSPA